MPPVSFTREHSRPLQPKGSLGLRGEAEWWRSARHKRATLGGPDLGDYKARTITLLRRPYGEADHVVVFLAQDQGKVRARARGTSKPNSKLAAAVQPFVLSDIMFGRGKGLDVVAQVQVVESFGPLREELHRLAHASYWCELTDRGLEDGQPAQRVFALLVACLRVGTICQDMVLATAYFQFHLMRELGFEIMLSTCPECGRAPASDALCFAPALGGVACATCLPSVAARRRMSPESLTLLQRIAESRASQITGVPADPPCVREAEGHVRRYVEYHIDANLKSLSFLRQVEGLME